jgi:CelD/BcsL family acetyltransferase involved in cellulose biosynthesis
VRTDSNLALARQALAPSRDPAGPLVSEGSLTCSYADLSEGYDAYLATRTSKFRNNLRRARRRAAERGLRVGELAPRSFAPSELPGAFLELHGRRFAESCFASPRERAFAERALPGLFTDRRLRAFAAFDGGRMIAISLCAVGDRSLGLWNGGLLPEALVCGAGKLLIDAAIRQACAEGLEELDFLRGDEAYKAEWSTGERTIGRLDLGAGEPREA